MCAFQNVADHMKLIEDDNWSIFVFLNRDIEDENGNILKGAEIWNTYKSLLTEKMNYAEKRCRLFDVKVQMTHFIIRSGSEIKYYFSLIMTKLEQFITLRMEKIILRTGNLIVRY